MLIQVTHKDKLDNLIKINEPETNTGILILIGLVIIVLTLLVIYRLKRKKKSQKEKVVEVKKSITSKTLIFSQERESEYKLKSFPKELHNNYLPNKKEPLKVKKLKPDLEKITELNVVKAVENVNQKKKLILKKNILVTILLTFLIKRNH